MPNSNDDSEQLLIRCPSCGQRFKVGLELQGRVVECGTCEKRFRIGDEVIVRGRKFYPGEKGHESAGGFARMPVAMPPPERMQPAHYAARADFPAFEPTSPVRLLAGAAGVLMVLLVAMVLFFGATVGGILDGTPTPARAGMGLFAGLVAGGLFLYANPRARFRAILGGLFCIVLLGGIPLLRTEGSESARERMARLEKLTVPEKPPQTPQEKAQADKEKRLADLRSQIDTQPLELEQKRLADTGSPDHAYGIWLRGLTRDQNYLISDHLTRTLHLEDAIPSFPRGHNEYLMVVTNSKQGLADFAEILKPVGHIVALHKELGIVEVRVRSENFEPGDLGKLKDPNHPAFYDLNKREIESIDLRRVRDAVTRLAGAEPKMYRPDICRRLVDLLQEDQVDFKPAVCTALQTWSDKSVDPGPSAEKLLRSLDAKRAEIPASLVQLLAKLGRTDTIPVILKLWTADSSRWEAPLLGYGPAIERPLIDAFPTMDLSTRKGAVVLLGQVGGRASLALLEATRKDADTEMALRIERAERSINGRLNK